MKIIRYILSHGLLIGIIIALVVGFYYRPLLLPDSWNNYLDKKLGQVSPRLVSFQAATPAGETEMPPTLAEQTTEEESVTEPPTTEALPPTTIIESPAAPLTQDQPSGETQAGEEVAAISPAPGETQSGEEVAAISPAPSPEVSDDVEVSSRDQEQSEAHRLFIQARTAFANGDMAAAEQYYLQITSQESDDPNAFGELGNVYYAQGKWQEAGEAYFEAANRLLEQNQEAQLNYLVRVIQGLAPEKAEKLKETMKSKGQQ